MSLLIVQSSFQKTLAFFPPADFGIYLHRQIRSIESDENKQSRKEMGDAGSVYGATLSHQNDFFDFDPFFSFSFFLKLSVTLSAFSTTPLPPLSQQQLAALCPFLSQTEVLFGTHAAASLVFSEEGSISSRRRIFH